MPNEMSIDSTGLARTLSEARVLDATGLARAEALAGQTGLSLDRAILQLGIVDEETVLRALAEQLALPFVEEVARLDILRSEVDQLGLPYLRRNIVAPVTQDGEGVGILTSDPFNVNLIEELAFQLERPIKPLIATSQNILKILETATQNIESTVNLSEEQAALDKRAVEAAKVDGPVITFVARLLNEAVSQGASDIHFASAETGIDVRFRKDGVLARQVARAPVNASSVFARLKVLSGMNVAERRRPQDGRITQVVAGRVVDFRVSSIPTQLGESIVVRVLDPQALRLGWEHLGFDRETEAAIRKIVEQPSGLFLVTGPTGSGKTTTLYTALNHLRSERRKIITIEDPVEYQLPDIDQVQIQDEIGLGFADALRSILRQDPNVIMVGEIRDRETAQIACRAALVGRLVLSTLHTNSANGAMARLLDLGVEAFILKDVLHGVLGQRLETIICPNCNGSGCTDCVGQGTLGRKLETELVTFQ